MNLVGTTPQTVQAATGRSLSPPDNVRALSSTDSRPVSEVGLVIEAGDRDPVVDAYVLAVLAEQIGLDLGFALAEGYDPALAPGQGGGCDTWMPRLIRWCPVACKYRGCLNWRQKTPARLRPET